MTNAATHDSTTTIGSLRCLRHIAHALSVVLLGCSGAAQDGDGSLGPVADALSERISERPSEPDAFSATSDAVPSNKEFSVDERLALLTAPGCDNPIEAQEQFAFFHRDQLRELHKLWFGLDGLADYHACATERAGGATRPTLMRCDLEQIADLEARTLAGPRPTYPATQVAEEWYVAATRLARHLQPLALACAVRTTDVSIATAAKDPACQRVKELFLDVARNTFTAKDPFPDAQWGAGNNGHKALHIAGPAIAFSFFYDLAGLNRGIFSASDRRTIETWLLRQARVVLDGQSTWQSWLRRDEREVPTSEGSNHFSQQNLALAAIGASIHNRCLVRYASYSTTNMTPLKLQIGRSLMIAKDTRPQPHDIMAGSFPVLLGEAVDRYRGQWVEGHISQALGYSSLVVGSLGTHAILYKNLKTSFALVDADLGADPLAYKAPRLDGAVSILDAIGFYGRMLQRNSPTGAFGLPRSNGEDRAYWCSPELTLKSPIVCDASTPEKAAALEAQQTFTNQHYTIFAPLIARGGASSVALKSASSTLFYNCEKKLETDRGKSLVGDAQGRLRDRIWPLHPLFWRPLTHDACAL